MRLTQMQFGVITYLIATFAVCVWTSGTFGFDFALFTGLFFAIPFFICLRVNKRNHSINRRELAYLSIVTLIVLAAVPFLIWTWFDTGMDSRYSIYKNHVELKRLVELQPRFKHVEIELTSRKIGIFIEGKVESQKDHKALLELIEATLKHDASGYADDVVVEEAKTNR